MNNTIDVAGMPKGGPYSHAVVAENLVFVSGQTGQTGSGKDTFETQFESAMEKISRILKEAGTSVEKVVKISVYLSKPEYFQTMNKLFGKYFPAKPPARTTLVTGFVNSEILVEIDVIASK
ncbi:MAG: RidA family protein [Thermoplasmata archaeon]|uniref:RidA family protein n=1 Tax=Candidatus Sysuiplasma superficiale TaxID=2823368 RepID=A0A8J8CE43_9ARCH|nr:RidA family protein [Candidatus Sysuiplasma superficiale]MBX8645055.1 RidA family protein [Candidatus Sysuiplasma superficiale]